MQYQHSIIIAVITGLLAGCGGGGGGGGTSSTLSPFLRSSVPYHTPTRVGTFQPHNIAGTAAAVTDIFVKDLNNDNVEEVVIGGRMTAQNNVANHSTSNIQIYGWNTGSFSRETSRWFSGTDNAIIGTEPSIKFGDFNGDGKPDMFVAHSTDMTIYGPGVVFLNNGTSFNRVNLNLGNVWSHDSAVTDLNGDGYADIIVTDYNQRPSIAFGSAAGTFNIVTASTTQPGGSGISVADYLGNGTKTVIMTDSGQTGRSDTHLYSWNTSSGSLVLAQISALPESRFYLSKWDSVRAANPGLAPHDIRNISMDFNRDGRPDVIVFSTMPKGTNAHGYSEVQFLRNDGSGAFTDVTDSVLRNYDTNKTTSYQPQLIDVNNDGLLDIFISSTDYSNQASTTVLVNTREGIFVEQYASVFSDFSTQIKNLTAQAFSGTQAISIVAGPNNIKYLVSTVQFDNNGTTNTAVYLAQIGSFGTVTAQASVNTLQSAWPWMSAVTANESLARSSSLFVGGVPVIDLIAALNPIGGLGISYNGRTGERRPIVGGISVPGLDKNLLSNVTAVDGLARNFQINMSVMSAAPRPMRPQWSEVTAPAQSWASRFVSDTVYEKNGFSAADDGLNWSTGFNTRAFGWNSPYIIQASLTQMQGSPWLGFSGIFGQVKNSNIIDTSISRTWNNGTWAQLGAMQTTTQIEPGLVKKVSTIYSAYLAGGWLFDGWNLFGGVQPTIISGALDLTLPSSVDIDGTMHYTNHKVGIKNQPIKFVGAEHRWKTRQHTFKLSGLINELNSYYTRLTYSYEFK